MQRRVVYDDALKAEYERLFKTCQVRKEREPVIRSISHQILDNYPRYKWLTTASGVPLHVIGVIHYRECGLSFDKHLHNGDPLKAKTTHVPPGRPEVDTWDWCISAADALRLVGFDKWHDWSIPGALWKLECYNGLGYRLFHVNCLSPYLWGGTNQYLRGGYSGDGHWDSKYVNQQIGVAALLKTLI